MVRRALFACAACALLSAPVLSGGKPGAESEEGPRMVITPASWDFGSVREGKVVKCAFEVKNAGKAELSVRSALENCECVKAELERTKIEPGKSSMLFVTIDTAGEAGAFTGTVSVLSNDPVAPMRTVRITGTVREK